jgi:uncharacterized protein YjbI with pentapeptide repeats
MLLVLAVAVVVAAVSWFVLHRLYGGQGAQVQLDVIRTAGTLVIGTGGAVALLLTARRQRYTELALVHTDRDATERRITELYTKAADQLGSDQAPVRLAGLYALERLANSTVEHRQTIVDVICAYLRMPYAPPQPSATAFGRSYRSPGPARRRRARAFTHRPSHAMPTSQRSRQEHAEQEQQVRLTAQNILSRNLRRDVSRRLRWWHRTPPAGAPAWPGIWLELTGALLLEFSLGECQLDYAALTSAEFTGMANFLSTQFTDWASFEGVQFTDWAYFRSAQFTDDANFQDAQFTGAADFRSAQFTSGAYFGEAQFTREANFEGAQFTGEANFQNAQFTGRANFLSAQFTGRANFLGAQFTREANFEGARVVSTAKPGTVWPPGWTTRPAKPDDGEDLAFLYLTKVEDAQDK